jgi:adenine-specific DNA-methyltransferase
MKYMGSKSFMLQNGLGVLIKRRAKRAERIVDLFSGAGHVAWFAAENTNKPVLAVDLQHYSKELAGAIILRNKSIDPDSLKGKWTDKVAGSLTRSPYYKLACGIVEGNLTREKVKKARNLCEKHKGAGLVWRSYGGYYFSPSQALVFDLLLKHLPKRNPARSVCLAALITAASRCVASPGHTAQPFKPTKGAKKFLQEAWSRNPLILANEALKRIAPRCAQRIGRAIVSDALEVAKHLRKDDLVIIDPPYSNVQYSRFYHVLETIATGQCGQVEGTGRYPSRKKRPQSPFSRKSQSKDAIENLLHRIARRGAAVIFTFPASESSNGLSGRLIEETARKWFRVSKKGIYTRFSTLGGNNNHRSARKRLKELILSLTPLKSIVQ